MKKVGVIGCGVVGGAVADGFEERGATVARYDKFKSDMSDCHVIKDTEVVFVCVPTETKSDGTQDLEPIEEVFAILRSFDYQGVIVVKSTVAPGTTKRLADKFRFTRVCHNPEFLTAAKPLEDFMNQPAVIIGSFDREAAEEVAGLYVDCQWDRVAIADSTHSTEMAKYLHNVFLASKVAIMNEFYERCQKLDMSYDAIRFMAVLMGGVGEGHTKVPGPDGLGYTGMCFPKDTKALNRWDKENGIDGQILSAVIESNARRRPEDAQCAPNMIPTIPLDQYLLDTAELTEEELAMLDDERKEA